MPSTMNCADEMERMEARAAEEQLEEVVIVDYKDRADTCRAEVERLVALAAAHTTEDIFVDASIHRHLIGALVQYTEQFLYCVTLFRFSIGTLHVLYSHSVLLFMCRVPRTQTFSKTCTSKVTRVHVYFVITN